MASVASVASVAQPYKWRILAMNYVSLHFPKFWNFYFRSILH